VLVHQAPLLVRHVLHERGARRNQFEVVVLLCHGREILAADAECWRSLSIPRAHIAAWARRRRRDHNDRRNRASAWNHDGAPSVSLQLLNIRRSVWRSFVLDETKTH